MSSLEDLPRYEDLPILEGGGRSGWGIFGVEDGVGRVNLQTPETIRDAARLVRRGRVFPLDAPLDVLAPGPGDRGTPRHRVIFDPTQQLGRIDVFDDVYDNFYPQASSQWDSLGHVGFAPGTFYNGASDTDVLSGKRNTIEHWSRRGIAGRAVLLDIPRTFAALDRSYEVDHAIALTADDLENARKHAGVEYTTGCVLLIRTGILGWYRSLSFEERLEKVISKFRDGTMSMSGIDHSESVAQYLWDSGAAAVAADNFTLEVWPPDRLEQPFGFLHQILIGQFGLALGELWDLDELAEDCARDGTYEAFFASAPLHGIGGIGSPANALAFK